MGRWSSVLAQPFLDFCAAAPGTGPAGGGQVLDVGCGTGALLQALAARMPASALYGVDPDAGFVAHARARFAGRPVVVDAGSALALGHADGRFDQTLSLLVLMVLDDPTSAALEMRRVTRAGGQVAACTWVHEGLGLSQVLWEEAVRLDPVAETAIRRFRHCNRPGQLAALWRSIGLVDVVETVIDMPTPFADFDDFWLPLQQGVGPGSAYLRQLPDGARSALRQALRARLLGCGRDRPFSLPAQALAVRGRVPGGASAG